MVDCVVDADRSKQIRTKNGNKKKNWSTKSEPPLIIRICVFINYMDTHIYIYTCRQIYTHMYTYAYIFLLLSHFSIFSPFSIMNIYYFHKGKLHKK